MRIRGHLGLAQAANLMETTKITLKNAVSLPEVMILFARTLMETAVMVGTFRLVTQKKSCARISLMVDLRRLLMLPMEMGQVNLNLKGDDPQSPAVWWLTCHDKVAVSLATGLGVYRSPKK